MLDFVVPPPVPGAPPPTFNTLQPHQRARALRSTRKLAAVLGTTPFILEPTDVLDLSLSHTSSVDEVTSLLPGRHEDLETLKELGLGGKRKKFAIGDYPFLLGGFFS